MHKKALRMVKKTTHEKKKVVKNAPYIEIFKNFPGEGAILSAPPMGIQAHS